MTRLVKSFPVKLAHQSDLITLETRTALADVVRRHTAKRIADARSAGVDLYAISQRHGMFLSEAMRKNRLLRSVAQSVVGWASSHEFETANRGVPSDAPPGTIAASPSAVTILSGGVAVFNMAGVIAAGEPDHVPDMPIVEVRLTVARSPEGDDIVIGTLVFDTDNGGGHAAADVPQPNADVDA